MAGSYKQSISREEQDRYYDMLITLINRKLESKSKESSASLGAEVIKKNYEDINDSIKQFREIVDQYVDVLNKVKSKKKFNVEYLMNTLKSSGVEKNFLDEETKKIWLEQIRKDMDRNTSKQNLEFEELIKQVIKEMEKSALGQISDIEQLVADIKRESGLQSSPNPAMNSSEENEPLERELVEENKGEEKQDNIKLEEEIPEPIEEEVKEEVLKVIEEEIKEEVLEVIEEEIKEEVLEVIEEEIKEEVLEAIEEEIKEEVLEPIKEKTAQLPILEESYWNQKNDHYVNYEYDNHYEYNEDYFNTYRCCNNQYYCECCNNDDKMNEFYHTCSFCGCTRRNKDGSDKKDYWGRYYKVCYVEEKNYWGRCHKEKLLRLKRAGRYSIK